MWLGAANTIWVARKAAFNSFNLGQDAGKYLRATPTCTSGAGNCDGKLHSTANDDPTGTPGEGINYAANQAKTSWLFSSPSNSGADRWGFSILPAGFTGNYTLNNGSGGLASRYYGRGYQAVFLTSTFMTSKPYYADGANNAFHKYAPVLRIFSYNRNDVTLAYYWVSGRQPTMTAIGNATGDDAISGPAAVVTAMNNTAPLVNAYSIRCIKVGALK
jgi:hypothetical protein